MAKNKKEPASSGEKTAAVGAFFGPMLLSWNHDVNRRTMPWKGEKDPYRIWLSEVILQQTRVEQGLKYYENFITAYPNVKTLAAAPDEAVFKLWEGLGYYSRCRNLLHAARYIAGELNGVFPSRYEDILALKGVGTYTAAAIGSFAYNLPHAVLDGNVFRVLSRIYNIDTPIDTTGGKQEFTALAAQTLVAEESGSYNQAIMDFGATVCKPVPDCPACFFNRHCLAYLEDRQLQLPRKEKKLQVRERWLHYMAVTCKGETAVRQRTGKDIWQGLYEIPLLETDRSYGLEEVLAAFEKQYSINEYELMDFQSGIRQKLTHQSIGFSFTHVEMSRKKPLPGFSWIPVSSLQQYAFPKTLKALIDRSLK